MCGITVGISDDEAIALAHNRLSINDLSPSSTQPLHHSSPTHTIHAVVNGEIYDDNDTIRNDLDCPFKSHSDSELILALYKQHGAPAFLSHLRGEFAFVLYDETNDRIITARDRFGIKPLFWTVMDGGEERDEKRLLIAAEAKAKVLPGCWMEVTRGGEMKHERYWDIEYKDKREVETRSVEEMVLGVQERLTEAIPSIVTHLVREQGIKIGDQDATSRVCCFTIEFPRELGFGRMDETTLAANFADSAYHCEQHNLDLNSVGKFVLSTLPREQGFKVVLTGEGADEHFAGYPFFPPDFLREPDLAMPTQAAFESKIPLMGVFSHGFQPDSQPTLDCFAPWVQRRWGAVVDCRQTCVDALSAEARDKIANKWHPLHASEYMWSKTMLANNLLTVLGDRTEMAHSVEARPPFLDHVLSEYVNGLPPSVKLWYTPGRMEEDEQGQGPWWEGESTATRDLLSEKWILREAGKPFITQELYERRKHPYSAPYRWLRDGPLYKTLEGICTREAVENLGFVEYSLVQQGFAKGFGEGADVRLFRLLLIIGGWVTLAERFGMKKVRMEDYQTY
ncbi:hypothetical protein B0T17DRAFT_588498 [Bombardia bombarda]|uniref:Glutamine amidotransferase type-2 domain-containing protein n=1 Tax=Bombardia bombarda TaxID=252184 RepID=A0AA39X720_9PEZI|nr:hypothetical protein B0T17DRAFT_588498 [Bombardia bombarda]